MRRLAHRDRPQGRQRTRGFRGFTLVELLVVMGIIAVLGALTVIAVQAIARDARIASARNTLVAALDQARGLAMKNSNVVLVAFRPVFNGNDDMVVELWLAEWTGESYVLDMFGATSYGVLDRFVPVEGIDPRPMPQGVKVAGPRYGEGLDFGWETQAHLPTIDQSNPTVATSEVPGRMLGIMFGPDGTLITRNSQSDSNRAFVDFNDDQLLDWRGAAHTLAVGNGIDGVLFFEQSLADDESFLSMSPFVAIFDDSAAREEKIGDWTNGGGGAAVKETELALFINNNADPVHFNRYTGVVMR